MFDGSKFLLHNCHLLKPRLHLVGLLAVLGVLASSNHAVSVQKLDNQPDTDSVPLITLSDNTLLNNGTYLYGETAKPEQIQQEYLVFEVHNGKVVGAFYVPHSSFDCFHGSLGKSGKLNLTVINSYEQNTYPYSVKLQDYQPVASISQNDQRMLGTCKAAQQDQNQISKPESSQDPRIRFD